MKNVTRRIASTQSIALGAAWAIALIAQPAFAQQPIERVEITGSSIKRVDAETALPVQIVTRQEIEATGAANVEQFLQGLGVALQGNNNTVAASASGATTGGVSSVSLRGLGSTRTLVLVDGRGRDPHRQHQRRHQPHPARGHRARRGPEGRSVRHLRERRDRRRHQFHSPQGLQGRGSHPLRQHHPASRRPGLGRQRPGGLGQHGLG